MVTKQYMGKPAGNFPAPRKAAGDPTATLPRPVPANAAPTVSPPTEWDPGYPTTGPAGSYPMPSNSMDLPVFTPAAGYSDAGVGHTGDNGGAG